MLLFIFYSNANIKRSAAANAYDSMEELPIAILFKNIIEYQF